MGIDHGSSYVGLPDGNDLNTNETRSIEPGYQVPDPARTANPLLVFPLRKVSVRTVAGNCPDRRELVGLTGQIDIG
jgi:hypothetical protein